MGKQYLFSPQIYIQNCKQDGNLNDVSNTIESFVQNRVNSLYSSLVIISEKNKN